MKKIGVYIGRFQPLHEGHSFIIKEALKRVDELIVLVGSANAQISVKNPIPVNTRIELIKNNFPNVTALALNDFYSEALWQSQVVKLVNAAVGDKVYIVGYEKDDSSYYLKSFPQWSFMDFPYYKGINATDLRNTYFESKVISPLISEPFRNWMRDFKKTEEFRNLREDWRYYNIIEPEKFKEYPYKETLGFMCADAVVLVGSYVLLIKRKFAPGKGAWALPGGFKNAKESFFCTALRELREETNLRVPEKTLRLKCKASNLFDDPKRSLGIPRVTNAFLFDIEPDASGKLPRVSPKDDALEAKWFSIGELDDLTLFEDHKEIIKYFVG